MLDSGGNKMIRAILASAFMLLVAACQTVPEKPGFSAQQVAVLREQGFEAVDDRFELGLADRLLFDFDKSELIADQATRLTQLSGALLSVGIHGARVEGHTDSSGSAAYNQALSERRALTVKQALAAGGMAEQAIEHTGLGEKEPLESNRTAAGRQENRRVVIIVSPADAS